MSIDADATSRAHLRLTVGVFAGTIDDLKASVSRACDAVDREWKWVRQEAKTGRWVFGCPDKQCSFSVKASLKGKDRTMKIREVTHHSCDGSTRRQRRHSLDTIVAVTPHLANYVAPPKGVKAGKGGAMVKYAKPLGVDISARQAGVLLSQWIQ